MEDSGTTLRCFMNFFAVFMVFMYEGSPFAGQTKLRFEMFLECEKYMVPSDATCELIMSMMEEMFFSTSERQVRDGEKGGGCGRRTGPRALPVCLAPHFLHPSPFPR